MWRSYQGYARHFWYEAVFHARDLRPGLVPQSACFRHAGCGNGVQKRTNPAMNVMVLDDLPQQAHAVALVLRTHVSRIVQGLRYLGKIVGIDNDGRAL